MMTYKATTQRFRDFKGTFLKVCASELMCRKLCAGKLVCGITRIKGSDTHTANEDQTVAITRVIRTADVSTPIPIPLEQVLEVADYIHT